MRNYKTLLKKLIFLLILISSALLIPNKALCDFSGLSHAFNLIYHSVHNVDGVLKIGLMSYDQITDETKLKADTGEIIEFDASRNTYILQKDGETYDIYIEGIEPISKTEFFTSLIFTPVATPYEIMNTAFRVFGEIGMNNYVANLELCQENAPVGWDCGGSSSWIWKTISWVQTEESDPNISLKFNFHIGISNFHEKIKVIVEYDSCNPLIEDLRYFDITAAIGRIGSDEYRVHIHKYFNWKPYISFEIPYELKEYFENIQAREDIKAEIKAYKGFFTSENLATFTDLENEGFSHPFDFSYAYHTEGELKSETISSVDFGVEGRRITNGNPFPLTDLTLSPLSPFIENCDRLLAVTLTLDVEDIDDYEEGLLKTFDGKMISTIEPTGSGRRKTIHVNIPPRVITESNGQKAMSVENQGSWFLFSKSFTLYKASLWVQYIDKAQEDGYPIDGGWKFGPGIEFSNGWVENFSENTIVTPTNPRSKSFTLLDIIDHSYLPIVKAARLTITAAKITPGAVKLKINDQIIEDFPILFPQVDKSLDFISTVNYYVPVEYLSNIMTGNGETTIISLITEQDFELYSWDLTLDYTWNTEMSQVDESVLYPIKENEGLNYPPNTNINIRFLQDIDLEGMSWQEFWQNNIIIQSDIDGIVDFAIIDPKGEAILSIDPAINFSPGAIVTVEIDSSIKTEYGETINFNLTFNIEKMTKVIDSVTGECEDAYVFSAYPDTNYGYGDYLNVSKDFSSPEREMTFIKFKDLMDEIPDSSNITLGHSFLNLYANTSVTNFSVDINALDSSWAEGFITYNNQPSYTADSISYFLNTGLNSIDISQFIDQWRTVENFGIGIYPEMNGQCIIYSRENSSNKPSILIEYSELDRNNPTILSITPSDNSKKVSSETSIIIQFSEDMDLSTFNSESISIMERKGLPGGGNPCEYLHPFNTAYDRETYTLTITPINGFRSDYVVVVTLSKTLMKDMAGNTILPDPYSEAIIVFSIIDETEMNPPTGLLSSQTEGLSVTLSWQAPTLDIDGCWPSPSDPGGYNVYRRSPPEPTFSKLNQNPITTTTFTDNDQSYPLKYFQHYEYRVTALDIFPDENNDEVNESFFSEPLFITLEKEGPTSLGGSISNDTTFTNMGSPFIISGPLTVETDSSLEIEPGVEIKFEGGASLNINGMVRGKGTESNPIIFTSQYEDPGRGSWEGIIINDSSPNLLTELNNFEIHFAKTAIKIINTSPRLLNGKILNYLNHGVFGVNSKFELEACIIRSTYEDSNARGVYLSNNSSPLLQDCLIEFNHIGIYAHNSHPYIVNSKINFNSQYGIFLTDGSFPKILYNEILNNSFYLDSYDLYVNGSGYSDPRHSEIDADFNWWGSIDVYSIRRNIYDFSDNTNSPFVSFTQFLEGPNGQVNENNYLNGVYREDVHLLRNNGPYEMVGSAVIDEFVGFTIEPGTEIVVADNLSLWIDGNIRAEGDPLNKIRFSSKISAPQKQKPGDWGGLRFSSTSDAQQSVLEHVVIEYATDGLYLDGNRAPNPLQVTNCQIRNVSNRGIYALNSSPVIDGVLIEDFGAYGISVNGAESAADIRNVEIVQQSNWGQGTGLYVYSGAQAQVSGTNTISGVNTGAYIYSNADLTTTGSSDISGTGAGYGIRSYLGNLYLQGLKLSLFNYGIIENSHTTTLHMSGCEITANNNGGIYLVAYATSDVQITGNDIYGNGSYELQLATYNSADYGYLTFDCTNNWWGTTDPLTIADRIYEHSDDTRNPKVDFLPLLDGSISGTPASLEHESYLQGVYTQDTVLTAAEGPYTLVGHVYVQGGRQLTIEPGTELRFHSGIRLAVDGQLLAQGTVDNPIIFTSNGASPQPGDWGGLRFSSTSDAQQSVLEHVVIEYATDGLYLDGNRAPNPLQVTNCQIRNVSNRGIYALNSSPVIDGVLIEDFGAYGISVNGAESAADIRNVEIVQQSNWGQGTGLYVYSGAQAQVSGTNTISGVNTGAYIYSNADLTTTGSSDISGTGAGYGIRSNQSNLYLQGLKLSLFNYGIYEQVLTYTVHMSGCEITANNSTGIYLVAYATSDVQITGNDIYGNGSYELQLATYNSTDYGYLTFDCTNNWWGTTDPLTIADRIYDHSDNALNPQVDFLPLLDGSISGTPASLEHESYLQGVYTQDTVLTAAEGPYTLVGHVYVQGGRQLTIEPGTELRFHSGIRLAVDGQLLAQGTVDNPIIFTSNGASPQPGDWGGLRFSSTSDAQQSVLEHVVIEYATDGLYLDGNRAPNPLQVTNCQIRNVSNRGIYALNSSPVIDGVLIEDFGAYGISVNGAESAADIRNVEIVQQSNWGQGTGLYVYSGAQAQVSGTNTISGVNTGAYIYSNADLTTTGSSDISGTGAGYGIRSNQSNLYLQGLKLSLFNYGIYEQVLTYTVHMSGCEITANNSTGIYLVAYATSDVQITGNDIYGNGSYELQLATYNSTDYGYLTFDCTNNWWGTTDLNIIFQQIIDNVDSSFLPLIQFNPISTSPHNFSENNQFHFKIAAVTLDFISYVGDAIVDNIDVSIGDEIGVFDPQGTCCGQFSVNTEGAYGLIHVYRDDPDTIQDEGAEPGDILFFKIWDDDAQIEYTVQPTMVTGTYPPTWTFDGDITQVDLSAITTQSIPLHTGWNLISYSVNKCFYKDTPPPSAIAMLEGIEYEPVNSIAEILTSIDGQYEVVRGFDLYGAHTYDPSIPEEFNDLEYMAAGYGYWIKMSEPGVLDLSGPHVDAFKSLELTAGWNLVGHWPGRVYYSSDNPPSVDIATPPSPSFYIQTFDIVDVLESLIDSLEAIRSFDVQGVHTYKLDVPEFINDLEYFAPGYGYWMKIEENNLLKFKL